VSDATVVLPDLARFELFGAPLNMRGPFSVLPVSIPDLLPE
jgi:hypothetical protein